jgi:HEAT repeat protein
VPIKRLKNTWHESERNAGADKTLADIASALGFIIWRVALESAKDLHRERYHYASDQQRAAVIAEFLAFLLQVVDRLTYEMLEHAERDTVINATAAKLAEHLQDNLVDLFGPGDYRGPFLATLNGRMQDYAAFAFRDNEPGYDFLRYFGDRVLKILGDDQTNRWVIDQIMEVSGPQAVKHVRQSVENLFE